MRSYRLTAFSLRTLLIALTVACILLAWGLNQGRKRSRAIQALQTARVSVVFKHRMDRNTYSPHGQPPGSPLLKLLLGEFYATRVVIVENAFEREAFTDREAALVANFPELDWLAISGSKVTDNGLKDIARITHLGRLDIESCNVSERAVNELRRALPSADVYSDFDE